MNDTTTTDQADALQALRQFHEAMGFSPEDVAFVEEALRSGRVREIEIRPAMAEQEAA
jgi:hypothetical protein